MAHLKVRVVYERIISVDRTELPALRRKLREDYHPKDIDKMSDVDVVYLAQVTAFGPYNALEILTVEEVRNAAN